MAGPSVMVRILADASSMSNSFKTAGSKASEMAGAASKAFGTMLNTLNRTGVLGPFGDALATANDAMANMVEHGHNVSDVMLGAGGALIGIGTAFSALGSKEQAAHQQLAAAISATGHSFDQYGSQIDDAIKHEEKYGNSSEQTQQALQALTQATHDPAEALRLLSTATDLAAAKHESLSQAAATLGKVYNGNTKLLKEYGIVLDKHTHLTATGQTATQALAAVLKGQAAASADTFNGHIKAIATTMEDHAAVMGERYGPALQKIGGVLTGLGAILKVVQAAQAILTTTTEATATAEDTEAASAAAADAASLPLIVTVGLIVLAVAALIAIVYELATHWSAVFAACKAAVADVFNWIRTYWPLLLYILLGPVGLAVALIIKNWQSIVDFAGAVIGWFRSNWPLLVAILTGPIGVAVYLIIQNWNTLVGVVSGVIATLRGLWNGFTGWLGGVAGQIAGIGASMWGGILDGFRAVINGVIDLWNRLHFTLPSINLGPLGKIGGGTVGVPQIPHLAQGGLMTADGLVYAHAGEVITPAPPKAAGGPAVVINGAVFHQEVDIDLLLRRTAWAVQTRAV